RPAKGCVGSLRPTSLVELDAERPEAGELFSRALGIEARIGAIDTKPEAVDAGRLEPLDLEHRIPELHEAPEHEDAEEGRERGEQHPHLEGDGDERERHVRGPAADVE